MPLDAQEAAHGQYSIGELRERLCRMSAESWRLCYVHLREGCHNCSHVRRPTQAEWDAEVLRWPLGDSERRSIECYEWSLHQYQQATERRERDNLRRSASRCERSRSRSPSRHGYSHYRVAQEYSYCWDASAESRGRKPDREDEHDQEASDRGYRAGARQRRHLHSRSRGRTDTVPRSHTRAHSPARTRSPALHLEYPPEVDYATPTYPSLANTLASGRDSVSQDVPVSSSHRHQAAASYEYRDPRYSRVSISEYRSNRQAEEGRLGGRVSAVVSADACPEGAMSVEQ